MSRKVRRQALPKAIFDIDGTLTDTMEVELDCYKSAIQSELGIQIPENWESLKEITDSAILAAACELHGLSAPDLQVERRIESLIARLLQAALRKSPELFQPIPGACEVFDLMRQRGWDVAIATGAWRQSALVKLEGARIPHRGIPLVSSSEYRARRDILLHAAQSLPGEVSAPVIYFGDGVWDGRAARELGYHFIGVAKEAAAPALIEVGAMAVIPDFSDSRSLDQAIETAAFGAARTDKGPGANTIPREPLQRTEFLIGG